MNQFEMDVLKMRNAQKLAFKENHTITRARARAAEKTVDEALEKLTRSFLKKEYSNPLFKEDL